MSEKIIKVEHLQQFFPAGGFGKNKKYVRAVDDVSFYIEKGETLGLVGESGCGKTTTGRSLLRLYEPTDGRIIYNDKVLFDSGKVPLVDDNGNDIIENGVPKLGKKTAVNMSEYRKKLQIVFQDPYASLDPRMTVGDIIGEAIDINKIASSKKDRQDRIIEVLRTVGLNSEHANRYPHEFSGGQRQRVGIARALVVNPDFIVADEPVSALDVSIQAQVVNMFEDLQKERGLTYLFIAHDLSIVNHISNRIGVMYLGKMVELAEYLRERFLRHLILLADVISEPDVSMLQSSVLWKFRSGERWKRDILWPATISKRLTRHYNRVVLIKII